MYAYDLVCQPDMTCADDDAEVTNALEHTSCTTPTRTLQLSNLDPAGLV